MLVSSIVLFLFLFYNERIPSIKNSCEIGRLGQTTQRATNHIGGKHHSHSDSEPTRSLASFAQDYRKLAIDCLKVLRIEMQLETIFHMQVCQMWCCFSLVEEFDNLIVAKLIWAFEQEMTNTEYLDDQDAEEPDDFIISLTAQVSFYLSLYVVFKRFLVVCGRWGGGGGKSLLFHPHKFHFKCPVSRVSLRPKIWPK